MCSLQYVDKIVKMMYYKSTIFKRSKWIMDDPSPDKLINALDFSKGGEIYVG